jgi:hypothetical protein
MTAYDTHLVGILLAERPRELANEGALRIQNECQRLVMLLSLFAQP